MGAAANKKEAKVREYEIGPVSRIVNGCSRRSHLKPLMPQKLRQWRHIRIAFGRARKQSAIRLLSFIHDS